MLDLYMQFHHAHLWWAPALIFSLWTLSVLVRVRAWRKHTALRKEIPYRPRNKKLADAERDRLIADLRQRVDTLSDARQEVSLRLSRRIDQLAVNTFAPTKQQLRVAADKQALLYGRIQHLLDRIVAIEGGKTEMFRGESLNPSIVDGFLSDEVAEGYHPVTGEQRDTAKMMRRPATIFSELGDHYRQFLEVMDGGVGNAGCNPGQARVASRKTLKAPELVEVRQEIEQLEKFLSFAGNHNTHEMSRKATEDRLRVLHACEKVLLEKERLSQEPSDGERFRAHFQAELAKAGKA